MVPAVALGLLAVRLACAIAIPLLDDWKAKAKTLDSRLSSNTQDSYVMYE